MELTIDRELNDGDPCRVESGTSSTETSEGAPSTSAEGARSWREISWFNSGILLPANDPSSPGSCYH